MKTKRLTHRPTGFQYSVQPNLEGEPRIFLDLRGNSYTSVPLTKKSLASLFNFLNKVIDDIDIRLYDMNNPRTK